MNDVVQQKIEEFFGQYKIRKLKKKEIFIRADEELKGIYYLRSGKVRMYSISIKGEEQTISIFKTGSFFPMMNAFTGSKNSYFFEATEPCEVSQVPKEDVLIFLQNNPDVLFDLMKRVYSGMEGLLLRMVHLMSGSAYVRLVAEFIILSKRFGVRGENGRITVNISEKDLASNTGLARETISREMRILKEKGIIDSAKGEITILGIEHLERELSEEY